MVISHIFFYWNAPRTPFIHFSERSGTLWNIHSLNKSFAELKLPSKLQQTGHYAVLGVQFGVSIRHATRMLSTLIFSVDTCGVCLTKLTLCLVSHKGEGLIWASIPDSKSAIRWWWHVMGTFSAFLAFSCAGLRLLQLIVPGILRLKSGICTGNGFRNVCICVPKDKCFKSPAILLFI